MISKEVLVARAQSVMEALKDAKSMSVEAGQDLGVLTVFLDHRGEEQGEAVGGFHARDNAGAVAQKEAFAHGIKMIARKHKAHGVLVCSDAWIWNADDSLAGEALCIFGQSKKDRFYLKCPYEVEDGVVKFKEPEFNDDDGVDGRFLKVFK